MTKLPLLMLVAAVGLATAASTAQTPKPDDGIEDTGQLVIVGHECDEWGVAKVDVVVTGPGHYTIRWSNKNVCGTPS